MSALHISASYLPPRPPRIVSLSLSVNSQTHKGSPLQEGFFFVSEADMHRELCEYSQQSPPWTYSPPVTPLWTKWEFGCGKCSSCAREPLCYMWHQSCKRCQWEKYLSFYSTLTLRHGEIMAVMEAGSSSDSIFKTPLKTFFFLI